MKMWCTRGVALLVLLLAVAWVASPASAQGLSVSRATLSNGMQVVVIHDPLAPVVSTILNYRAGSDEQQIAGQAHALEHMMFRGSTTISTNQLMESIGITGGNFDADTQNAVTQYYFTVPSQYLDIALRLERSRATGLLISQAGWNQERNAITQEVTMDESNTVRRLISEVQRRVLEGSIYAKNGLGTRDSFAHQINAPQLRAFYHAWYHPNNAIYVIAGDVDGPSTIAKVKALFAGIPSAPLPKRPSFRLPPLKHSTYTTTSDLPITIALAAYRMPGYDSPDYPASDILANVLSSPRGDLAELVATGKSYQTGFVAVPFLKAAVGIMFTAVPIGQKPEDALNDERAVLNAYMKNGVPADLVDAAKRRVIADAEARGNSIEGLAFEWSNALAVQGVSNPDALNAAYARVTAADVNRVLRTYVTDQHSVVGYAVPKPGGAPSAGGAGAGGENVAIPPSRQEPLPSFAQHVLDHLSVPQQTLHPADMTLSNGIRLIVQPEQVTHSVIVRGEIRNNSDVQTPAGKEGVGAIASGILPFGTTTYGRIEFQKQLDAIAANASAGTAFSLSVLDDAFDRGVQLLADEELHPAFPDQAFTVLHSQAVKAARDTQQSPDFLAQKALDEALYPAGDPSRRLETPESVGSVTLDDVKAYYREVYRPDMTTIVVVGNVSPDAARTAFEKYFGGWKAEGTKPDTSYPSVPLNQSKAFNVPATGRVQSAVRLVEITPLKRADPEYAQMQVLNTALTGGFYSSLLYHDLREVHGYAYNVNSEISAGKTRSTFEIGYGSDPQNVNPAQQDIVRILKSLQTEGLSADRLQRAKALLMGDVPIRQDSYGGVASVLSGYAVSGLPLNENILEAERELATTNDALKAAAATYIRPDAFVRIITGPAPK